MAVSPNRHKTLKIIVRPITRLAAQDPAFAAPVSATKQYGFKL
jgi:hypothetical protein